MRIFQQLYDRILTWAGHRHAGVYLGVMSFTEAIFFPIPPDFMLAPMCLSEPRRAWRYATICTLASIAGAVIAYLLGDWLGQSIRPWLLQSHYAEPYLAVVEAFERYGVVYMLLAGFTPIPFKIFTVSAGLLKMSFLPFIVATLIARSARFYMVAGIIYWGGPKYAHHLRRWVDWIGWVVVVLTLIGLLVWHFA